MTKFYIDSNNNYIGGFEGDTGKVPVGAIEVPFPPNDARFTWDGSAWIEPVALKDVLVDEKREVQISKDGVTLDDKMNAVWLHLKGDPTEFNRIDAIIEKAATDIPK